MEKRLFVTRFYPWALSLSLLQVKIRWQFQVYAYIHMIWVLEKRRSHPSKKAPSFQCEKGPMILNFPLL